MPVLPAIWDGGSEWGDPVSTDGAEAYWGPATVTSGMPTLFLAVNGQLQNNIVQSASFGTGRTDWTSTLAPGNASFRLVGTVDAVPNNYVVVSTEAGPMWAGRVDTITFDKGPDSHIYTNITATDLIGILGQAQLKAASVAAGTLKEVAETLAATAGVSLSVTDASASGLPTLLADASYDGTVLAYINRAELSSNALLFLMPDGTLRAVIREASDAADITPIVLSGNNTPSSWTEELSVINGINKWVLTKEDGTVVLSTSDATAIAAYGEHSYIVDDYLSNSSSHFTDWVGTAGDGPRSVVTNATFPIYDYSQDVLTLAPLDYIEHEGITWQVMSVSHDVRPGSWSMSITADQTQSALVDLPDPPEAADPTTSSQTVTATKVTTTAKNLSTGSLLGNGGGDYVAVGKYSGILARGFFYFPFSFPVGFTGTVKKATMTVKTGPQAWVAFGSSPRVIAQRIKETWAEGTYDVAAPSQYSVTNATVHPGPSRATSGQVERGIATTTNTSWEIDVTTIVQAWADGDDNHGIALISANESGTSNTTEFYSDDHATAGNRPTLTIVSYVS